MKLSINIKTLTFTALISAFVLAFAFVAYAEDSYTSGDVNFRAGATVAPNTEGRSSDDRSMNKPPLGQIRANIENRLEMNSGVRNAALVRLQERASTTVMFKKMSDMRQEMLKRMEANRFEFRKNALLRELQLTIRNLENISIRIDSRITKIEASSTVSMTDARNLLATANAKLSTAKELVLAFQNMTPPTKITASGTTTVEVDITKPRVAGDAAIQAVKDARDAFKAVVQSIAHSMGDIRVNENAEGRGDDNSN